jgi:hypothetical protein
VVIFDSIKIQACTNSGDICFISKSENQKKFKLGKTQYIIGSLLFSRTGMTLKCHTPIDRNQNGIVFYCFDLTSNIQIMDAIL